MIVAFSCSSPVAGVALLDWRGKEVVTLFAEQEGTRQNASGACLGMLERVLERTGRNLCDATLFVADLGPGSFIGVRVGVTLAKTFAFALGAKAAGASSFDLIDPDKPVALPSKKNEFFVREPGRVPYRTAQLPENLEVVGYGFGGQERYPKPDAFASLLAGLQAVRPEELLPAYLIEPSISVPKHR